MIWERHEELKQIQSVDSAPATRRLCQGVLEALIFRTTAGAAGQQVRGL